MHSAADKLNAEEGKNNGRLPYGLMPATVASLALLNIVVTAKQMICMMERREREQKPALNVDVGRGTTISSLTDDKAVAAETLATLTNTRKQGRKKGSSKESVRKNKENYYKCLDSIVKKYTKAKDALEVGDVVTGKKISKKLFGQPDYQGKKLSLASLTKS